MNKMDLTFSRIYAKFVRLFSYKTVSSKRCYRRFPSEEVFGIESVCGYGKKESFI